MTRSVRQEQSGFALCLSAARQTAACKKMQETEPKHAEETSR